MRTRDINPATTIRHRAQMRKMLAMIAGASTVVLCGVAFLWGQASLTSEGYRHSKLTNMIRQEHEREQQWKHEQAQLYTQSNIEQKAQENGMIKAPVEDTVTAGLLHAPPAVAANEYSSAR